MADSAPEHIGRTESMKGALFMGATAQDLATHMGVSLERINKWLVEIGAHSHSRGGETLIDLEDFATRLRAKYAPGTQPVESDLRDAIMHALAAITDAVNRSDAISDSVATALAQCVDRCVDLYLAER